MTGDALASFLLGLPATRQVQNGVPTMDLRQWSADAFAQDTWRVTPHTTIDMGVRYEFMAPLVDTSRHWSNLYQISTGLTAFIGGESGMPRGLMYPNKLNFAPRLGIAHHVESAGLVMRAAYGIFCTPVDLNTGCNQLHDVPLVFPITQQSDNFTPSINGFNFPKPVLGSTVVSFTAFDPHAPPQYIQQWSASVQKSLGHDTTVEIGCHGERGFHLQRSDLIDNDQPGPGTLQPRRPYPTATFLPGTVIPPNVVSTGLTFPVSTVNMLQDTARSSYDPGYINLRRRYSKGLTLLANYTYSKNLSNAPDFRSPCSNRRFRRTATIWTPKKARRATSGIVCGERGIRYSRVWAGPRLSDADAQLEAFRAIPGAERLSIHHLGVRRHSERRHSGGRESNSRQLYRPAGIRVQPRRIRDACRIYLRRRGARHGYTGRGCRPWTSR